MLEYFHTKRLWLVRVKFLENGLYLLCNILTQKKPLLSTKTREVFSCFHGKITKKQAKKTPFFVPDAEKVQYFWLLFASINGKVANVE